ncbi:unnamed protein product [Caenorhabditis auriculariae]|uniref:Uncharacterized protein n=1 Tax=Caenorhabditis auriculariae TaxID=2777116 RepID=A0A8S1GY35_9PELO|nr:unnamed protein product [Caenorhabditis auriculariae]
MCACCCPCMAADVLSPGFWEIGHYKHNVRRIKDGIDQLDEYAKMVRERAEIEAKYTKMLQQHSEKWRSYVDRTIPAGTVKTVWNDLVGEASTLSKIHNNVKDQLVNTIVRETAEYRKNNLHTSILKGPKEIREIEDGFEKAQKPWKKKYDKMDDKRKAYYSACRQEKSALVNLQNCQADTSVSQDGASKFRERHEKMKEEVQKTKIEYEKALTSLNEYRSVYEEAMAHVFKACQEKELQRCQFFIEIFKGTQQFLADLVRNNQISGLHQQLEQTLRGSDTESLKRDLHQWSLVNGVESHADWPVFVEYSPEIRNIAAKGSGKDSGGVILTRQITKNEDIPAVPGTATVGTNFDQGKTSPKSSSDSDTNTFDSRKTGPSKYKMQQPPQVVTNWDRGQPAHDSPPLSAATPDSAKYGDFDDFQTSKPATVLYDYNPLEGDEIQLRKGETIEVLTEPDSLGWCTGRKNGTIGLFPASYVQCV